jgi:hypothetical protein
MSAKPAEFCEGRSKCGPRKSGEKHDPRITVIGHVLRKSSLDELVAGRLVFVQPLHLKVRAVVPADILAVRRRAFVPVESQPCHRTKNAANGVFRGTDFIRVFDAEDKRALMMPGKKPVK